jgi:glycosyltransferase involved in cell wall biosynthesis
MKILHVMPDLNAGGAELMMKRLIEAQISDPEYEHSVVSLRSLGAVGLMLREMGVNVSYLNLTSATAIPKTVLRLRRLIKDAQPDVVQTWMYHADLLGGLAARAAGLENVLWGVRVADITPGMGVAPSTLWVRRLCAKLSAYIPARIIYVCHSARPPHEAIGYDPSKALVIPNGYVLPTERSAEENRKLRRTWDLPEDAVVIGSAGSGGRRIEQKDYRTFVAAASLIAADVPAAHFVIMGKKLDWDAPELVQLIEASGFKERFRLLGERRDIAECLAALDVFCLHSVQEGFPNVVAEAMAASVPCVVTDVGDAAIIVGEVGSIVQPRQAQQLATAVRDLVSAGSETRQELGRKSRQRIKNHFSIGSVAQQYATLYQDLMRA